MHAAARQVPHLSVEELFDSPARVNASISPDGTRIAYLAPWRDRLNVWVQSLDSETLPESARPGLMNNWYLYAGDPSDPQQEADLLARSPISRADQIRTPLMVAQGANDIRVVKAESDRIVEALRGRGVEVEYMVKDNEGHGFVNPDNNIDLFRAADAFLARHLA
jgi:dipeptidyl aminopeptidase/acylaminoacyl peptidase